MPMLVERTDIDKKIKIVTDLIDVSGTTPVELYTCTPEGMKFVIRKLLLYNKDSADHEVILGSYNKTAGTWDTDKIPIKMLAGQWLLLGEKDLPEEFVVTTDADTAVMSWAVKLDTAVTENPVKVKAVFEMKKPEV